MATKSTAKRAPRVKKPTPATSFKVTKRELVETLTRIIKFASNDPTLPSLHGIAFEMRDQRFTAMATDRFALGVDAIDVLIEREYGNVERPHVADFGVFVSKPQVTMLTAVLKAHPDESVVIAVDGDRLTIADITVGVDVVKIVEWRSLVRSTSRCVEDISAPRVQSVNPALAAKFAHIKRAQLYLHNQPSKAMFVTDNDRFVGILMPVRPPSDTTVTELLDRIAPEVTK